MTCIPELALSTWSSIAYLQESSQSPLTSPVVDLPRASNSGQHPPVSIVLMPGSVVNNHTDSVAPISRYINWNLLIRVHQC